MRIARLLPLLLLPAPVLASADKVDDYLQKFMADKGVPGLQVGMYRNGRPVKVRGYGTTRLESGVSVDERTLFNIGSVTKQFTAAAIMLLEEEGKLRVEDSIRKTIPELPQEFEGVKLLHILGHTSGMDDYGSVPGFEFHGQPAENEFVAMLAKSKLGTSPGDKYAYSNIGYSVLGVVVHRASGVPYEDYVAERILRRLGMNSTQFVQPGPWPASAAVGFNLRDGKAQPGRIERAKVAAPSGAILTNVVDMARWDAALRSGSLLKGDSLDRMWTVGALNNGKGTNYGYGWSLLRTRTGAFATHTGSTVAGFRAAFIRQLDGPYSAVIFANLGADVGLTGVLNEAVKLWRESIGD